MPYGPVHGGGGFDGGFEFTPDGLAWLLDGHNIPTSPSLAVEAAREVCARYSVDEAFATLIGEAAKCIVAKCDRAAMVLLGLAFEDAVWDLAAALAAQQGAATEPFLTTLTEEAASPTVRLAATRDAVRAIRDRVKRQRGGRVDWWSQWEDAPDSLSGYLSAVRLARNKAAHDPDADISPLRVALLLGSAPTAIEQIAAMTAFLRSPPAGVDPAV